MITLSFNLSPQQIDNLQELENQFTDAFVLLSNLEEEEKLNLQKFARVSMIGSSTRIENAQLTDIEVDWIDTILEKDGKVTSFEQNKELIEKKLSKERERSIEEVAGCRNMLLLIYNESLNLTPLKEIDIRNLHYELLVPYKKAASYIGNYKTQPNYVVQENKITGEKRIVFQTADAGIITQAAMTSLVDWYNQIYKTDVRTIPLTCEFIYRFLAIHPFQDGNGRLGRGLFLLLLFQSHSKTIATVARYLAIDRYIEKYKEEYYFTLNRCSNGKFQENPSDYNMGYFLDFIIKVTREAIIGLEVARKRYQALRALSDSALKVLACFKENPEIKLQTQRIAHETNLPLRTVAYALTNLLNANIIQKYGQGAATRYQLTF